MLEIDLEHRDSFEPGEEIEVGVSWDMRLDPTQVQLRVVWNTSGKGTQDVEVAHQVALESPRKRERRQVRVSLPSEPYSFSGRLISVVWALELIALPSKLSTRREIIIAPGGQEVLAKGRGR